ncbi:Deoxycytidine kinase 1 [Cytospora paraplurivora]|uniref:Deoxycytidine kinase 1 n=1 Tax=Cytospora paraplurivora TaxID=2898453 RepID=A0AAN9YKU9_9PEZI
MPWQPLPRIAFAIAAYPFQSQGPEELPLEIGDELYIIEETPDGNWLRGYLVAQPSLLAGLTSVKGQTLEARIYNGIFPRSCVEVREVLGETEDSDGTLDSEDPAHLTGSDLAKGGLPSHIRGHRRKDGELGLSDTGRVKGWTQDTEDDGTDGLDGRLSVPVHRVPDGPRPQAPVPMLKIGDETPTSASEPLIDEIASCLREWHSTNLHELLLSRQYSKLDSLGHLITALYFARQQFLHNVLTACEYRHLREKTVWDLVRVNKLCGGEVIVRDPNERGRVLTADDSVVEVTKLQSVMSLLDEPPRPVFEPTSLHHLVVDVRSIAGSLNEPITLELYLAGKPLGGALTQLSEPYIIEVPAGGSMGNLNRNAHTRMRTLFADLSPQDIGSTPSVESEIFLIVKVFATELIVTGEPNSRSGSVSREAAPFSKDRPPLATGNKAVRRSIMWAGKSTKTALSRGAPMIKVDERIEERPFSGGASDSRDGSQPPGTASSKASCTSSDGVMNMVADRLVGVGCLTLKAIMKQDEEIEQVINIWSPLARFHPDKENDGWDPLVQDIVESKSGQYEKSRNAERLQLHLRAFDHPDSDVLIKATPTLLSGICKTRKMGFSGAPTKSRSDIYVTLNDASLSKQALLSRYGGSAASMPANLPGKNLQVTMEVRRSSGERIDACIYPSSNSDALDTWKSFAVEPDEPWRQTLRLVLNDEDVTAAHVVVYLANMPNPPFAVAYLPLWDQQAFVRDGAHDLLLYKLDEYTSTAQPGSLGKGGYMSLPSAAKGHSADVTGPIATLRLNTYLCSTRYSQDRVVLALLKWKDRPRTKIPSLLKEIIFVDEIEIVKLLDDVLNALFGILVEWAGDDEYEDLVFTALVRVLAITHDRRFNIAPLVDHYAETKFNYPFATPCLVRSFTRLLQKPTEPETARKLRATFKVVRHILKFITHGRGQQREKEAGIGITNSTSNFSRHLRCIFKALDSMMRSTAPVLVGSQTLAVQHFHTWLPELSGLLTTEEILHIAIDFMDSCSLVKGKLVLYKLVLIINYSKLDIFSHPEQRSALSANTVRWIAPHWGHTGEVTELWKDQVRLCCSILASQVNHLGPEIPDYIPKIIDSYLCIQAKPQQPKSGLSLLFPTSYPFPLKPTAEEIVAEEAIIELSAILSALANSPSGMQLELTDDDLSLVLENTLHVHMSILQGEAFPPDWLSVHIYHHKSTMRTLQYLSSILLETFLPHPDEAETFNTELWKVFFTTLLKLVGSPSLALETFPEQKRRAVWKIAGDVREHGAELLRRTWEAIGWDTSSEEKQLYGLSRMGGYQVQYVPTLVGPIVELCLSVHEGLRGMAVEVLQTMMVSEWSLSEDLSVIQTEVIESLDAYFKSQPLTESILQKLFVNEVLERFEPLAELSDEPLCAAVRDLMATVDEFLDLLVAVHSGDGSGEASNLINRLRLMEFLRDMQKEDIFVRYVHQLANLQAGARNFTEAGLALRLHADLYDWDPIKTCRALADPEYPAQSYFERKERIYFDMIKFFEDGEAWSSALAAYKELEAQYELNVFDFAKLARTQRAVATIYETIAKGEKRVPKYYKVTFRGLGFPASVRDKEYIYEGWPNERASGFTDRVQEQYPTAQIVTSDNMVDVEGQFLVISSVSTHRDLTHHVFQRARVPQIIRDYIISAHPQRFSISTKRSTSGHVEEHSAEKIVYTTAEAFPTILRRSEIVHTDEVRLGAKEAALERIVRKTQEMTAVEKKIVDGDKSDEVAQLLVDAISISVNPDSENSVAYYRQLVPGMQPSVDTASQVSDEENVDALEDETLEQQSPELDAQENAIKMALIDHALMIKRCLTMFSRSTNQILLAHHGDLQRCFESTFAPEIDAFTPPQPAPVNPLPTPPSARPVTPKHQHKSSTVSANGTTEVSTLQTVPLRPGRGARLSFLGGRKKEVLQQQNAAAQTKGEQGHVSGTGSREGGNDGRIAGTHSRSISRAQSHEYKRSGLGIAGSVSNGTHSNGVVSRSGTDTSEWMTDSGSHASHDTPAHAGMPVDSLETKERESMGGVGTPRLGGMKKRLSMLRLGKKTGRGNGDMGALDEE